MTLELNVEINLKNWLFSVGGLAEEVDEKVLQAALIPFGDILDINIPLDYETEKHRGFAFVEFEFAEVMAGVICRATLLFTSHSKKQSKKGRAKQRKRPSVA